MLLLILRLWQEPYGNPLNLEYMKSNILVKDRLEQKNKELFHLNQVEQTKNHNSENIKLAWAAVQRNGESLASYADFTNALGGVSSGRRYTVRIASKDVEIRGKYATYTEARPCGVYSVANPNAIYESTRYQWTPVDKKGGGVAFDLPWTGVNNCTDYAPEWMKKQPGQEEKNQKFSRDYISEAIKASQGWDFEREYNKNGKLTGDSWTKAKSLRRER